MNAAAAHAATLAADNVEATAVRQFALALATRAIDGTDEERDIALAMIRSRPQWEREYKRLCQECDGVDLIGVLPSLVVKREEQIVGHITLKPNARRGSIGGVSPGTYSLELDSGRVIWKEELSERHLLWRAAFPGRPLDLAADSEAGVVGGTPVEQISVLDGQLQLSIFPSLESGRIEIELRTRWSGNHES